MSALTTPDATERVMDLEREVLELTAKFEQANAAALAAKTLEGRLVEVIRTIGVKAGIPSAVYGAMCHEVRTIINETGQEISDHASRAVLPEAGAVLQSEHAHTDARTNPGGGSAPAPSLPSAIGKPCQHEPYEGRCVHCNVRYVNGFAVA